MIRRAQWRAAMLNYIRQRITVDAGETIAVIEQGLHVAHNEGLEDAIEVIARIRAKMTGDREIVCRAIENAILKLNNS